MECRGEALFKQAGSDCTNVTLNPVMPPLKAPTHALCVHCSYGWVEHDGRNFGVETILDGNHNITVSFVKRSAGPYGGDWTARISVSAAPKRVCWFLKKPTSKVCCAVKSSISFLQSVKPRPIAFLFYAYLPDSTRGMLQSFAHGNELKRLRGSLCVCLLRPSPHCPAGFTHELGAFQVNFHTSSSDGPGGGGKTLHQSHLSGYCPREDALLPSILSALAFKSHDSTLIYLMEKQRFDTAFNPPSQPNLWVAEVTVQPAEVGPADSPHPPPSMTALEVEFVSQASTSSDAVPLIGSHFDEQLANFSAAFQAKFNSRFPVYGLRRSEAEVSVVVMTKIVLFGYPTCALAGTRVFSRDAVAGGKTLALSRSALSNLLGGIGYFYGSSMIQSPLLGPDPLDYGPSSLYTATPSRQQFPRGFLWDEGFHGLLLAQWDVEMALQSLSHWLDLMNAEGWIPREQILGWEARSRVPAEFVVQSTSVANPPTLMLVVEALLQRLPTMSAADSELFAKWATNAFPRLHSWFVWFNTTQVGSLPTTYRWRGRPSNNPFQLNPLTLSSGLDDFPRASHPTPEERHLDLRCWMALFARVLSQLANFVVSISQQQLTKPPPPVLDALHLRHAYAAWSATLTDPDLLDQLHWSDRHTMFADYGLHTDAVVLTRPPVSGTGSAPEAPPQKRRHVTAEPRYQYITSALGYGSLFPLLLRILPPDSPRLPALLDAMSRADLLSSPHGLRSLSVNSPYYRRPNTEHDPPYWRGAIWLNINYLALQSLRHYARNPGTPFPVAQRAEDLSRNLTASLLSTVLGEFNRTGYLWEQYDDKTGFGQRAHPFSGWTALISLVMPYDSVV
ncbi:unnamed protein product [Schistocephalus solidus]|uniref:Mannosyl-oligosaccharide glucosidase n=3 Tax=Schistocephalus solidus TaxID=70667 RepID=A0A183T4L2_SCHSO|nr:unnamed protein product [Schistocephalus solidus]